MAERPELEGREIGEGDRSPPSFARAIGPREFRSLAASIGPEEFRPFAEAIGPELPRRTVPVRKLPRSSVPDPLPSTVRAVIGGQGEDAEESHCD